MVAECPSIVMAAVSPTRTMSTPAASAISAEGKSYAVTITIGSASSFMSASRGRVTGFVRMSSPSSYDQVVD